MALSEERSEQTQQQWLSRLARERQDLSASVEAALVDHAERGYGWQDEEDEQDDLSGRSRDKALIPPRISLQSRVMPAIRPGNVVREVPQERRAAMPKADAEEKPVPAAQNSGIWARFAQRLTASFAVFGGALRPETESYELASEPENLRDLTGLQEAIPPPRTFPAEPGAYAVRGAAPVAGETRAAARQQAVSEAIRNSPAKPLPAGRKIRLETTPMETASVPPALPEPAVQHTGVKEQEGREGQEKKAPGVLALGELVEDESMTSAHLPAVSTLYGHEGTTSAHLPAMEVGKAGVAPRMFEAFAGSGAFESGQCDVSVANTHVTSSCVVLVTLTANPGPVVVQYVSLQPQVGFTAHLTAPAAMRVPFNYVILAGE